MDLGLFLLLGLGLSVLLLLSASRWSIIINSLYWLGWLLWSLNAANFLTPSSLSWANLLNVSLSFHIDGLAKLFVFLISSIGIIVFIYAYIYSAHKPKMRPKLFSLLQLFAISMLGIVLADDLITLFISWELTSISSYLLIQFDVTDSKANDAAFDSLFLTVLGSLIMLVGFIDLHQLSGSWSIQTIISQLTATPDSPSLFIAFLLILAGAVTKSAQLPFHFWLPGAMKAPTPVSAYLHSATMVNAGIYLLARFHPLFASYSWWYPTLACFGMTTMVVSSILSLLQNDLKALLAYTTIFALGAMLYLQGSNQALAMEAFAIFLVFHAFYKAAAFMLTGIIDIEYKTRDLRILKGIARSKPVFAVIAIIIFGSMAGLPPFFGFTAKELIYEAKLANPTISYLLMALSLLSGMFIAAASFRVLWKFFRKNTNKLSKQNFVSFGLLCPGVLTAMIVIMSFFQVQFSRYIAASMRAMLTSQQFNYTNPDTRISFALSLATVLGGIIIFFIYQASMRFGKLKTLPINAKAIFRNTLQGTLSIGNKITSYTQEQDLSYVLSFSLIGILFLLFISLGPHSESLLHSLSLTTQPHNIIATVIFILAAIGLAISFNFLNNLVSLGLIGIATSYFFLSNGAIDLAITQLLIEVLTVILILITFKDGMHLKAKAHKFRPIHFTISALLGCITVIFLNAIETQPIPSVVSDYYKSNSLTLAHGKNIVNVILVDFRALDTLGEVIVVVAAVIAISVLLKKFFQLKRGNNVYDS